MKIGLLVFLLVASLIALECSANTAVPSGWNADTNLAYGTCSVPPISGLQFTTPPYSGSNTNPLIAEAVGYKPYGNTCNFRSNGTPLGVLNTLPLWKQEYAAALAQDLYAGFKLPQANSDWNAACAVNKITQAQASSGNGMCRNNCGVCFLVSGPSGSAVFFGNEIGDYGAVGQNGVGINVHLYNGANSHISSVRTWSGVSKDISIKRVPCPVGNTGIQVYWYANYGSTSNPGSSQAVFFTILNHRTEVKTVQIRAAQGTGGDQTWRPLVADWTNRWHFETYTTCAPNGCATWQIGWGAITRGSSTNKFELMITDVFGATAICRNLTAQNTGAIANCVSVTGAAVQLPIPNVAITPCNGASYTTVANINFYSSDELVYTTGTSASKSPAVSKSPVVSKSPAASKTPAKSVSPSKPAKAGAPGSSSKSGSSGSSVNSGSSGNSGSVTSSSSSSSGGSGSSSSSGSSSKSGKSGSSGDNSGNSSKSGGSGNSGGGSGKSGKSGKSSKSGKSGHKSGKSNHKSGKSGHKKNLPSI